MIFSDEITNKIDYFKMYNNTLSSKIHLSFDKLEIKFKNEKEFYVDECIKLYSILK